MTDKLKQMKRGVYLVVGFVPMAVLAFSPSVSAQMMGSYQEQNPPSQSDIQSESDMQKAGQAIYKKLQSGDTSCQKLSNDDYEKLGEYFMGLSAGSTENHVYWDQQVQQMMGDQGDTQMHVVWGERGSGCHPNATVPANTPAFLGGMMNPHSAIDGNDGYMMGGYANASWSATDSLLAALLAITVVGGVYAWFYRRPRIDSSLNTLKKRYASGEISKKEFDEMSKALKD